MSDQTESYYTVQLPEFSGPLDLLLHLIEQNELDITSVSLVEITDQYLSQIEELRTGRIEHLMDFIVIGARLLLIKSRALLPQPKDTPISDDEEDPAEALARQLRQYKRFKETGIWLSKRRDAGLRSYLRVAPAPHLDAQIDFSEVNIESLSIALRNALERTQMLEDSISIATEGRQITIGNQINKLRNIIAHNEKTNFLALLSNDVTFQEVSVTLLAVLELIKRNEIIVLQQRLFGPIEILPAQVSSSAHATDTSR